MSWFKRVKGIQGMIDTIAVFNDEAFGMPDCTIERGKWRSRGWTVKFGNHMTDIAISIFNVSNRRGPA